MEPHSPPMGLRGASRPPGSAPSGRSTRGVRRVPEIARAERSRPALRRARKPRRSASARSGPRGWAAASFPDRHQESIVRRVPKVIRTRISTRREPRIRARAPGLPASLSPRRFGSGPMQRRAARGLRPGCSQLTDHVFRDPMKVHSSLVVTGVLAHLLSSVLRLLCLRRYLCQLPRQRGVSRALAGRARGEPGSRALTRAAPGSGRELSPACPGRAGPRAADRRSRPPSPGRGPAAPAPGRGATASAG